LKDILLAASPKLQNVQSAPVAVEGHVQDYITW